MNSVGLVGASLKDFQRLVDKIRSDFVVIHIEYDVAELLESVVDAQGPILIEMEKEEGKGVGIELRVVEDEDENQDRSGFYTNDRSASDGVVQIVSIIPASTAERSGAVSVGDVILGVNGVSLRRNVGAGLSEARRLLNASPAGGVVSLEVLPVGVKKKWMQRERMVKNERDNLREFNRRAGGGRESGRLERGRELASDDELDGRMGRNDHYRPPEGRNERGKRNDDRFTDSPDYGRVEPRTDDFHQAELPSLDKFSSPHSTYIPNSSSKEAYDDAAQRQLAILSQLTKNLSSQIQVDPRTAAAAIQSLSVIAALKDGSGGIDTLASAHSTPSLNRGGRRNYYNANKNNHPSKIDEDLNGGTLRRFQKMNERKHSGSCGNSLLSSGQSLNVSGQVCRTECVTVQITIVEDDDVRGISPPGFGFEIDAPSSMCLSQRYMNLIE